MERCGIPRFAHEKSAYRKQSAPAFGIGENGQCPCRAIVLVDLGHSSGETLLLKGMAAAPGGGKSNGRSRCEREAGSSPSVSLRVEMTISCGTLSTNGNGKGRSRFPKGMTERKARATTGGLHCVQDDGDLGDAARATHGLGMGTRSLLQLKGLAIADAAYSLRNR